MIPAGNARPGRVSFREAPYQRGILDTFVDPSINRITVKSAAQIGKTLIALMVLGYFTEHEPMTQILMQPNTAEFLSHPSAFQPPSSLQFQSCA